MRNFFGFEKREDAALSAVGASVSQPKHHYTKADVGYIFFRIAIVLLVIGAAVAFVGAFGALMFGPTMLFAGWAMMLLGLLCGIVSKVLGQYPTTPSSVRGRRISSSTA